MKKWILIMILFLFPISTIAYSNEILVGGNTIGIEVHAKGVYVVGFYSIDGEEIAKKAGFQIGDIITRVNDEDIHTIDQLNEIITEEDTYTFEVLRGSKKLSIPLTVVLNHSILKTGLYVKDQVFGLGTLSYIDPETRIYGSLGHEILESSSMKRFWASNGAIHEAEVSSVHKSESGKTGALNGSMDMDKDLGTVLLNEEQGVFGLYQDDISSYSLMPVADSSEIRRGKASIRTVLQNQQVEDFDIEILSLQENSSSQNILFQIVDSKLLSKTGGIVQGMSGSPIIQNSKIIGVVNYVIIDEPDKGYGIFITNMLEKGDQVLS